MWNVCGACVAVRHVGWAIFEIQLESEIDYTPRCARTIKTRVLPYLKRLFSCASRFNLTPDKAHSASERERRSVSEWARQLSCESPWFVSLIAETFIDARFLHRPNEMLRKRRQQQLRLNKPKQKKQQQKQLAGERKRKLLLCIFNRGLSAIFHFVKTFALRSHCFSLRLVAELSNEFLMWSTACPPTPPPCGLRKTFPHPRQPQKWALK